MSELDSKIDVDGEDGLKSIRWTGTSLELLDQRALPGEVNYVSCHSAQEVASAIKDMIVRGAPSIAIAAGYGAYPS